MYIGCSTVGRKHNPTPGVEIPQASGTPPSTDFSA